MLSTRSLIAFDSFLTFYVMGQYACVYEEEDWYISVKLCLQNSTVPWYFDVYHRGTKRLSYYYGSQVYFKEYHGINMVDVQKNKTKKTPVTKVSVFVTHMLHKH